MLAEVRSVSHIDTVEYLARQSKRVAGSYAGSMGKLLIVTGLALVGAGLLITYVGKLPGDFTWRGKNWSVSFPLATCLLVSVVGSVLLWVFQRFFGGPK